MVDEDITKRGRIWGDIEGLELKTREKELLVASILHPAPVLGELWTLETGLPQ